MEHQPSASDADSLKNAVIAATLAKGVGETASIPPAAFDCNAILPSS